MLLFQPLPLTTLLVEAEVAPRPRPPLVVAREPQPGFLKDSLHVCHPNARIPEWIDGHNVRPFGDDRRLSVGDIPIACLVRPDADVTEALSVADEVLEWLDLEYSRAE